MNRKEYRKLVIVTILSCIVIAMIVGSLGALFFMIAQTETAKIVVFFMTCIIYAGITFDYINDLFMLSYYVE